MNDRRCNPDLPEPRVSAPDAIPPLLADSHAGIESGTVQSRGMAVDPTNKRVSQLNAV